MEDAMDGRVEPRTTDADLEGLDESQRAEVHEYEGGGPTDGVLLTDMARDRGEDFVEDDRPSEIADGELDALGMTILSPEDLGDEAIDDDIDSDMLDDDEI
jgi:hypothetical protein